MLDEKKLFEKCVNEWIMNDVLDCILSVCCVARIENTIFLSAHYAFWMETEAFLRDIHLLATFFCE